MESKPILLVDVDGFLNVFGRSWDGQDEPNTELEKVFTAERYTIRFPTGLTERMQALASSFDCVWATTWASKAKSKIAPQLGMGFTWPVIHFTNTQDHSTWKLPDVREWVERNAEGRRVAWGDDDLMWDAEAWARDRTEAGTPTILIQTNPEEGLTQRQTDNALDWALRPRALHRGARSN